MTPEQLLKRLNAERRGNGRPPVDLTDLDGAGLLSPKTLTLLDLVSKEHPEWNLTKCALHILEKLEHPFSIGSAMRGAKS